METNHQTDGEFRFQVDTGLVSELGDRLVARPSIALAELVKNAYDADATFAKIIMQDITTSTGCIIVEDNGLGMTFEAIQNHWMRIATQNKIDQPQSPLYKRNRTGAKGIGRFAAGRLASRLTVDSVAVRTDGRKEATSIHFDWATSFAPGKDLNAIPVQYERRLVPDDTPTGVILLLDGLKDSWDRNELELLRRDLIGLVNPFGTSSLFDEENYIPQMRDPGFSIQIEVPEFPDLSGHLQEAILQGAWSTLTGNIEASGSVHYIIEIRSTGEIKQLVLSEFQDSFKQLAGTRFTIHHFVFEKKKWRSSELGVREAIRYARKYAGVRIYFDGFRVYGYGEPGNDWLALDELRAQRIRRPKDAGAMLLEEAATYSKPPFLRLPGNNQLFGIVELTQSHHGGGQREIEINISRDRLVENEAFEHLKTFVRNGIFWLTLQYARVEYKEQGDKQPGDLPIIEPLTPKLEQVVETAEKLVTESQNLSSAEKNLLQDQLAAVRQLGIEHDQIVETQERHRIGEMSMLRVLASVGTLTSFLNHQLSAISNSLGAIAALFESFADYIDASKHDQYVRNTQDLQTWRQYVKSQINLLSLLLGKRARSERRSYNIKTAMDDVYKLLQGYADEHGIRFSNEIPSNVVSPPMFLAELHAILINIFTNALKAVRTTSTKRIEVRGGYRDETVYIQMLDTGRGLDIAPEQAFLPFETTSLPDNLLGEGTGLGLYVVDAFVESYGGSARFVSDLSSPWVTCIEIELPSQ